jgi:DNA-binding MarR family transcriptional regulator
MWPYLSASALYFEEYYIELRPMDDMVVETLRFVVVNDQNTTLQHGNYTIGTKIEGVRVTDAEGLLQFTTEYLGDSTTIMYEYRRALAVGESRQITFSFRVVGMVGRSTFIDAEGLEHEDRVISTGFTAAAEIRRMDVLVELPRGAWLARSIGEHATAAGSPVRPLDAEIRSNGTNLVVAWSREGVDQNERFDVFVAYNFPGREVRKDLGIAILALLAGLAIGMLASFMITRRRSQETRTQHTLALLEEGERRILKSIMDNGGEIRQDALMDITGYSKARVSQLVTRLEKLGLVRKERFERTNKLFVTGEIRET